MSFMCGSGWRAAEVLWDMRVMGYENISLYSDGATKDVLRQGNDSNMKRVIRSLTVTAEALLGVVLIILNRFAYLHAGMNHHARFKRMTLIRDFLSNTRWIIWLAVAILCVVVLLRSHVPSWYRAIGLLLAMAFAILVGPRHASTHHITICF